MSVNLYALIEARPGHHKIGEPFYIGIGNAKRPHIHLKQSRSKKGHRNLRLHEILVSHSALGIAPRIAILGTYPNSKSAGDAEKEAIKRYGRIAIEVDGTLCNLAGGGQGPDSTIMQLPEVRQRIADAQKRRSPESLAASLIGLEIARTDPDAKEKHRTAISRKQKAHWANPETKARHSAALRGKKKTLSEASLAARRANAAKGSTPEANAKKGAASKALWADPEYRAKMAEKRKAAWSDPQKRANMLSGRAEGISKSWENPETRARRIAGIKAATAKTDVALSEHRSDPD